MSGIWASNNVSSSARLGGGSPLIGAMIAGKIAAPFITGIKNEIGKGVMYSIAANSAIAKQKEAMLKQNIAAGQAIAMQNAEAIKKNAAGLNSGAKAGGQNFAVAASGITTNEKKDSERRLTSETNAQNSGKSTQGNIAGAGGSEATAKASSVNQANNSAGSGSANSNAGEIGSEAKSNDSSIDQANNSAGSGNANNNASESGRKILQKNPQNHPKVSWQY